MITASTGILETSGTPAFLKRFTNLGALKKAIDEFYDNAFAPEIVKILGFVESSETAVSLIAKHAGVTPQVKAVQKSESHGSNTVFQTNMLRIRQAFESALEALRLDNDHIIFIDGIDVRPSDIAYNDYFECVATIAPRWNRMIFYDGSVLHSGDITAPELLSTLPSTGRLTLNGFFTSTCALS